MYICGDNHVKTIEDQVWFNSFKTIVKYVREANQDPESNGTFPMYLMGSSVIHYMKTQAHKGEFDYGTSKLPKDLF